MERKQQNSNLDIQIYICTVKFCRLRKKMYLCTNKRKKYREKDKEE